MGLLLGMMCHFHCEESLFILQDKEKGFTILNPFSKSKDILVNVNEAVEESKVIFSMLVCLML